MYCLRNALGECGKGFNVASINVEGKNDIPAMSMAPLLPPPPCASKLITRSDDTEKVVKEWLRVYYEKSQPVEEFYRSRGILMEFTESWPKLLEALNLEEQQSAAA